VAMIFFSANNAAFAVMDPISIPAVIIISFSTIYLLIFYNRGDVVHVKDFQFWGKLH
jgi:hypothetical protein